MTNKYMYFVANWKMFGDLRSLNSLDKVIKFSKNNKKNKLKIVYCPPNTLIRPLSRRLKKTKIEVGAQNCHHSYDYGAHTGQVNSTMIKNVGAKYVILGHSENRQLGETDNLINLKLKSALFNFKLIKLSVSPSCLFSECPKITYFAPTFLIIVEFTWPVCAP